MIQNASTEKKQYFEISGIIFDLEKVRSSRKMILLSFSDITSSVELNEYKNKMLATVSHDIRTPLQGAFASLECAKEQSDPKKTKKLISQALLGLKGLFMLIRDLLDYSQFLKNKFRLNRENRELELTVKTTFKLIKFQAKKKGVKLEYISNIPSSFKLLTDHNRLQQILFNLLGNALKFTMEGFIKLSVCFSELKQRTIEFRVQDTGIGISESNLDKLFKLFGKLEQKDSSINPEGIGLGLAISNKLAHMLFPKSNDAGIHVTSEENKGSTFFFFLPILSISLEKESSLPPNISYSSPDIMTIPSESKINSLNKYTTFFPDNANKQKPLMKKVLVVDDEILCLEANQNILSSLNIDIETATNGKNALEIIEKSANHSIFFTLIILDHQMPILNGLETA